MILIKCLNLKSKRKKVFLRPKKLVTRKKKRMDENVETSVAKFKKEGSKKGFLGLFINRLYPYFGGKKAAPHNMQIELMYIKNEKK